VYILNTRDSLLQLHFRISPGHGSGFAKLTSVHIPLRPCTCTWFKTLARPAACVQRTKLSPTVIDPPPLICVICVQADIAFCVISINSYIRRVNRPWPDTQRVKTLTITLLARTSSTGATILMYACLSPTIPGWQLPGLPWRNALTLAMYAAFGGHRCARRWRCKKLDMKTSTARSGW
jgi:hypothetical protein